MFVSFDRKVRRCWAYKTISSFVCFAFISNLILPSAIVSAQTIPTVLNLPVPGTVVPITPNFTPMTVKGLNIDPQNPLQFDFIIDQGDTKFQGEEFNQEANKLIKYFLASLTVPEKELWVNLSPYEKDRIIPGSFGQTEMGRDLLAQDYLLKQLTASLMNPEDGLGKSFWNRVYEQAQAKFGTSDIPLNTFNKIWIVPETASIYEHTKGAFLVKSHLKVMLEEDYLALEMNQGRDDHGVGKKSEDATEIMTGIQSQIVKEILIPEIEKEVNEGQTFANLRQIYNSFILAAWYKKNLKQSLLGQVYADQNKTKGVETGDKEVIQKIYDQYVDAFKKGVYNLTKEEYDPTSQEVIPRKYFSGGAVMKSDYASLNDPQEALAQLKSPTVVTWRASDAGSLAGRIPPVALRPGDQDKIDGLNRLQLEEAKLRLERYLRELRAVERGSYDEQYAQAQLDRILARLARLNSDAAALAVNGEMEEFQVKLKWPVGRRTDTALVYEENVRKAARARNIDNVIHWLLMLKSQVRSESHKAVVQAEIVRALEHKKMLEQNAAPSQNLSASQTSKTPSTSQQPDSDFEPILRVFDKDFIRDHIKIGDVQSLQGLVEMIERETSAPKSAINLHLNRLEINSQAKFQRFLALVNAEGELIAQKPARIEGYQVYFIDSDLVDHTLFADNRRAMNTKLSDMIRGFGEKGISSTHTGVIGNNRIFVRLFDAKKVAIILAFDAERNLIKNGMAFREVREQMSSLNAQVVELVRSSSNLRAAGTLHNFKGETASDSATLARAIPQLDDILHIILGVPSGKEIRMDAYLQTELNLYSEGLDAILNRMKTATGVVVSEDERINLQDRLKGDYLTPAELHEFFVRKLNSDSAELSTITRARISEEFLGFMLANVPEKSWNSVRLSFVDEDKILMASGLFKSRRYSLLQHLQQVFKFQLNMDDFRRFTQDPVLTLAQAIDLVEKQIKTGTDAASFTEGGLLPEGSVRIALSKLNQSSSISWDQVSGKINVANGFLADDIIDVEVVRVGSSIQIISSGSRAVLAEINSNEEYVVRTKKGQNLFSFLNLGDKLEIVNLAGTTLVVYRDKQYERTNPDSGSLDKVGGIDLNSENLKMDVNKQGEGFNLPTPQIDIESLQNVEGFVPVIINVAPAVNLPLLLGIGSPTPKVDVVSLK